MLNFLNRPEDLNPTRESASIFVDPNEKLILYTLDSEEDCSSIEALLVSNYFKYLEPEKIQEKRTVKCASYSPNNELPILVSHSNGTVLELKDIIKGFFTTENIPLYVAIYRLLGGYIRTSGGQNLKQAIELIDSLPSVASDCDNVTQILLFTLIQVAKFRLSQSDPVRRSIERSEYLGELFVRVLENNLHLQHHEQ